jgi:hypothetical protein
MNSVGYLQRQMNLNHLAKGVYFVHVTSAAKSVTQRIIIQ